MVVAVALPNGSCPCDQDEKQLAIVTSGKVPSSNDSLTQGISPKIFGKTMRMWQHKAPLMVRLPLRVIYLDIEQTGFLEYSCYPS